jgi:hypothetical protein
MKSPKMGIVLACLAMLWIFGPRFGSGQTQDPEQKWSVETHDQTNFPLVGKHRVTSCRECHLELVFEGTPRECEACHWERRQDDRHQLRLGIHCGDCHTPYSWKVVPPNKWNHTEVTGYPLEGLHRTLDCVDCHGEDGFDRSRLSCFDCHEEDYSEAEEPDHRAAGFPTQCQLCHLNQNTWEGAVFSHDSFILRGAHRTAGCSDCHSSGVYSGLSSDCVSCHLDDYNGTDDPDHQASGFPTDCAACHGRSSRTWEDADFSHAAFPLSGQHKLAQCNDCHSSGVYSGLSSDCVSCHLDDYNSTDDPDHRASEFPTDCAACHGRSSRTWEDADFSHTAFPLSGQHKLAQCTDCHSSGVYSGLSSDCVSCHLDDYNSTDDPDHRASEFPTDCAACHGTSIISWQDVNFDHSTYWTLRGAHTTLDCSICHARGYDLPRTCYGCHSQDYDNTNDPDHSAAGFPTDCELCHYPTHLSWSQAVFDHQFPIGSGKHSSADCSDCHVSSNFKEFSCLTCHTHNRTRMDNQHEGVAGYVYESQACFACHPQGRE